MKIGYALAVAAALAPAPACAEISAVARLRAALEAAVAARQIPGATVMVIRHGKVLADVTTGWADIEHRLPLRRDAIFRLYSMSKPITGVAMILL